MRKKRILIIESCASDTLSKIAFILRKKGYETIFISLVKGMDFEALQESYNKLISFDFKFFSINLKNVPKILLYSFKKFPEIIKSLYQIRSLNPDIVISRATPNWLCFLSQKYFKNSTWVYFPYDIRSFSFRNVQEALSLKIPRFEIDAERYCFENSDGIIHKGDETELNFLKKQVLGDMKVKCPTIYFFPYCMKKFFVSWGKKISRRGEINIVYVGHAPASKSWVEGARALEKQKIHLHIYSKTNNLTEKEDYERIKNFYKDVWNSKFFHVHKPVSQKKLAEEISKYDYGTYAYSSERLENVKNVTGNKLASYLEACIPILCPDTHVAAAKLLKKYKIGFSYAPSEFNRLRDLIEKNKPEKFKASIIKAREELSMESQIQRLEEFFKKAEEYKFKNKKNK